MPKLFAFLLICILPPMIQAQDTQQRIVSLAPHITELIYAVGGGDNLVGVSAYSNYPLEAQSKVIVGDAFRVDLERLIGLKPDLVFYWKGTTTNQVVQQLKQHRLAAIPVQIDTLNDIPKAMDDIAAHLSLNKPPASRQFSRHLNQLKQQKVPSHTVFIQISERPLYTVSSKHYMSEAAALCGLKNVFPDLPSIAASVTKESVIVRNPDVIIRMQAINENSPLQQWSQITAIKQQQIALVDADVFSRPTPRILESVENLCRQVNQFAAGE